MRGNKFFNKFLDNASSDTAACTAGAMLANYLSLGCKQGGNRMNRSTKPEQLRLSEAWERAARNAGSWEAWIDMNSRIAEAEMKRPLLPLEKDELARLLGNDWKEKRKLYEEERDAIIGPLTSRRAFLREEINDALREQMTSRKWQATGRPDDPIAIPVDIDPEAWRYFDLGAVRENCVIFPRYFRRNETRKFIYQVTVTPSPAAGDAYDSSPVRRLVLAIEKQMIPQTRVFNQHADLIREINRHLALSLQASAKQLNFPGDLKSLSDDKRLSLLRHFLHTVLPELGTEFLNKMALEILEKKVLSDSLDRFSQKTLQDVAREALAHRIASHRYRANSAQTARA
jgi:hypothetical protein